MSGLDLPRQGIGAGNRVDSMANREAEKFYRELDYFESSENSLNVFFLIGIGCLVAIGLDETQSPPYDILGVSTLLYVLSWILEFPESRVLNAWVGAGLGFVLAVYLYYTHPEFRVVILVAFPGFVAYVSNQNTQLKNKTVMAELLKLLQQETRACADSFDDLHCLHTDLVGIVKGINKKMYSHERFNLSQMKDILARLNTLEHKIGLNLDKDKC